MELRDLPPVFRDVAEAIGLPAALALVERWGGVPVWVPKQVTSEHPLVELLGLEAAGKLSELYGGDYLRVPRCARAVRLARDAEIQRRYRNGQTAKKLALQYHLTERQIWNIVSLERKQFERRQFGLF